MQEQVSEAAGRQFSALVIDNDYLDRDMLRIALESAKYRVIEARTGQHAENSLVAQRFDLLILDLQIPALDGRQFLKTVRAKDEHKHTHVIVITDTAHMATTEIHDLADFVMFKPINVVKFTEFARRIRSMATRAE